MHIMYLSLVVECMIMLIICFVKEVSTATILSENFTENETLDITGNPYEVANTLLIVSGASVVIDPGVILKFHSDCLLQVEGELLVNGSFSPVLFTGLEQSLGYWGGVQSNGGNLSFTRTIFEFGGPIVVSGAFSEFQDSVFNTSSSHSIEHNEGELFIRNCSFYDSTSYVIYVTSSSGKITFEDSLILGGFGAFYIPENNEFTLRNIHIFRSEIRGTTTTGDYFYFNDLVEFDGGTLEVLNCTFSENSGKIFADRPFGTNSLLFQGNRFESNTNEYIFHSYNCRGDCNLQFFDNVFINNDGYINLLQHESVTFSNNLFEGNHGDYLIYIDEYDTDPSSLLFHSNTFFENEPSSGYMIYFKRHNTDYSPHIFFDNNNLTNNVASLAVIWFDVECNFVDSFKHNILSNYPFSPIEVKVSRSGPILDATENWWGTTSSSEINNRILDFFQDVSYPVVDFSPYICEYFNESSLCHEYGTNVVISTNVTWNISSSPYEFEKGIFISSSGFLTIEEGVIIRFGGSSALTSEGSLLSHGRKSNHISIFGGILNLRGNNQLFSTEFHGTSFSVSGIETDTTSFQDCIFNTSSSNSIEHKGGQLYIRNCSFYDSTSYVIYVTSSSGKITFEDSLILGGFGAFYILENNEFTLRNVHIFRSEIRGTTTTGDYFYFNDLVEFDGGTLEVLNCTFSENSGKIFADRPFGTNSLLFQGNRFESNTNEYIFHSYNCRGDCNLQFFDNVFINNDGYINLLEHESVTFSNNLFEGNHGDYLIYIDEYDTDPSSLLFTFNTFFENEPSSGYMIYFKRHNTDYSPHIFFDNNNLTNNVASLAVIWFDVECNFVDSFKNNILTNYPFSPIEVKVSRSGPSLNATENWWGFENSTLIAEQIVDNRTSQGYPEVNFIEFLSSTSICESFCGFSSPCSLVDPSLYPVCFCSNFTRDVYCPRCFGIIFDDQAVCNGNGECIVLDRCDCHNGYYGEFCNVTMCFGVMSNDSSVCSKAGKCSVDGCYCEEEYFGTICNVTSCGEVFSNESQVCSGKGQCLEHNTCSCSEGYFGTNCEVTKCGGVFSNESQSVCSGNGICYSLDNCTCFPHYNGTNCENYNFWECFNISQYNSSFVCSGHGNCTGIDSCVCNSHYHNLACDDFQCDGLWKNDTDNVCTGRGSCVAYNTCSCLPNYFPSGYNGFCDEFQCWGKNITDPAVCNFENGTCLDHNTCICNSSVYYGLECKIFKCYDLDTFHPLVCYGHGDCQTPDNCVCDNGYNGTECEYPICGGHDSQTQLGCGNRGTCVAPEVCSCNSTNYDGNLCQYPSCFGLFSYQVSFVCAGHGNCSAVDTCECESGYHIDADGVCNLWYCNGEMRNDTDNICNGQGSCDSPEMCTCISNYYPSGLNNYCDQFDCGSYNKDDPEVCNRQNGTCIDFNNCSCVEGYEGSQCETFSCGGIDRSNFEFVCSGHGICALPEKCECWEGYNGTDCSFPVCHGWDSSFILETCSGNGYCFLPETCSCNDEYDGDECQYPKCFGLPSNNPFVCSAHGDCSSVDGCDCEEYYYGSECFERVANSTINENIQSVDIDYYTILYHSSVAGKISSNGNVKDCTLLISNLEQFVGDVENTICVFTINTGLNVTEKLTLDFSGNTNIFRRREISDWEGRYFEIIPFSEGDGEKARSYIHNFQNDDDDEEEDVDGDEDDDNEDNDDTDIDQESVDGPSYAWSFSLLVLILPAFICSFLVICFSLCLICCVVVLVVITVSAISGFIQIYQRYSGDREKVEKFNQLEDVDILIEEQELDRKFNVSDLRIDRSLFNIEKDEINLIRVIGSNGGSNATVYLARWNGNEVAYKCFTCTSSQESLESIQRELKICTGASDPNIIRFFGCSLRPPRRLGYLMEYCPNGEIGTYIQKKRGEIPLGQKIEWLLQISKGMTYLHSRGIIHRDLKCENVLLDEHLICKIMDFGISRTLHTENVTKVNKTFRIGTSIYMSPEIVYSSIYNEKTDVFSFGIMVFLIIEENFLPYGSFEQGIELRVANNPDYRPRFSEKTICPGWLREIATSSWDEKVFQRKGFKTIQSIIEERLKKMKKKKKEKKVKHELVLFVEDDEEEEEEEENRKKKNYYVKCSLENYRNGMKKVFFSENKIRIILDSLVSPPLEENEEEEREREDFIQILRKRIEEISEKIQIHKLKNFCSESVEKMNFHLTQFERTLEEKERILKRKYESLEMKTKELASKIDNIEEEVMFEKEMEFHKSKIDDLGRQKKEVQDVKSEWVKFKDSCVNLSDDELEFLLLNEEMELLESFLSKKNSEYVFKIIRLSPGEVNFEMENNEKFKEMPIVQNYFYGIKDLEHNRILLVLKKTMGKVSDLLGSSQRDGFGNSLARLSVIKNIFKKVHRLHEMNICHLNLSLETIFYNEEGGRIETLLGGLKNMMEIESKSVHGFGDCGVEYYSDIFHNSEFYHLSKKKEILKKNDVYSVGICLFVLIFEVLPFENWYRNRYLNEICYSSSDLLLRNRSNELFDARKDHDDVRRGVLLTVMDERSEEEESSKVVDLLFYRIEIEKGSFEEQIKELIHKCVRKETKLRLSMKELVSEIEALENDIEKYPSSFEIKSKKSKIRRKEEEEENEGESSSMEIEEKMASTSTTSSNDKEEGIGSTESSEEQHEDEEISDDDLDVIYDSEDDDEEETSMMIEEKEDYRVREKFDEFLELDD